MSNDLSIFVDRTGIPKAALARKLGVTPGALHDILTSRRRPGLSLAVRIEAETGGAVPAAYWPGITLREDTTRAATSRRANAQNGKRRARTAS